MTDINVNDVSLLRKWGMYTLPTIQTNNEDRAECDTQDITRNILHREFTLRRKGTAKGPGMWSHK